MLPTSLQRNLTKSFSIPVFTIRLSSNLTASETQAISRIKHPSRGGQNLTLRYRRLEKSLRSKETRSRRLDDIPSSIQTSHQPTTHVKRKLVRTFRGLAIPEKPKAPEDDECCMSGCAICVHDLYQESLKEYNDSIASLRISLNAMNVTESEWPEDIRVKRDVMEKGGKSVTLRAFEEMERMLKEKHRREDLKSVELESIQVEPVIEESALNSRSRSKGKEEMLPDIKAVYEGLRWVLFSNR